MNQEKVGKKGYKRYKNKADEYLNDKEKAEGLLTTAREKASAKKGPLTDAWDKIQLILSLFEDWLKGKYKTIPFRSIAMATVAIIYFVIPTDLIPDFILGLGYGDDIAVLAFVFKQINKDLEAYKIWKEERKVIDLNPEEADVEITIDEE